MSVALFDNIAHQYDDNRGGLERGVTFAGALRPHLLDGRRVLEIGVGTGVVAKALKDVGFDVVGIDNSREMLKFAGRRIDHVVWSDMNRLPFLDEYFGSAYSIWSLHLSDDVAHMLQEVRRILQPGGRYMNCSAANGPLTDEVGSVVWKMQVALATYDLLRDSPQRLAEYAAAAGFKVADHAEIRHSYSTSPAKLALHLERRSMSTLQQATDEQFDNIVRPAIETLRTMADPDGEIVRHTVHKIVVLEAV